MVPSILLISPVVVEGSIEVKERCSPFPVPDVSVLKTNPPG